MLDTHAAPRDNAIERVTSRTCRSSQQQQQRYYYYGGLTFGTGRKAGKTRSELACSVLLRSMRDRGAFVTSSDLSADSGLIPLFRAVRAADHSESFDAIPIEFSVPGKQTFVPPEIIYRVARACGPTHASRSYARENRKIYSQVARA